MRKLLGALAYLGMALLLVAGHGCASLPANYQPIATVPPANQAVYEEVLGICKEYGKSGKMTDGQKKRIFALTGVAEDGYANTWEHQAFELLEEWEGLLEELEEWKGPRNLETVSESVEESGAPANDAARVLAGIAFGMDMHSFHKHEQEMQKQRLQFCLEVLSHNGERWVVHPLLGFVPE